MRQSHGTAQSPLLPPSLLAVVSNAAPGRFPCTEPSVVGCSVCSPPPLFTPFSCTCRCGIAPFSALNVDSVVEKGGTVSAPISDATADRRLLPVSSSPCLLCFSVAVYNASADYLADGVDAMEAAVAHLSGGSDPNSKAVCVSVIVVPACRLPDGQSLFCFGPARALTNCCTSSGGLWTPTLTCLSCTL